MTQKTPVIRLLLAVAALIRRLYQRVVAPGSGPFAVSC